MLFVKKCMGKVNQIRKQNWSAPAIMTVFILISMFLVFSFESIGILRRETNLDHRVVYLDTGILNLLTIFSC
jgi:hypothetical protein